MAEYFPLLDRAVSGLTEPTAEARRTIYERARAALIGQLRRMDPPVPEEDIARESGALDEAIARVEAKFAEAAAPGPAAAVRVPPVPEQAAPRASNPPAPLTSAPPRVPPPPLPTGTAPPVMPPPSRERPVLGPRPAPAVGRPAMPVSAPFVTAGDAAAPSRVPPRSTASSPRRAAPPPPRGTRPVMALRPVPPAAPPEAKGGAGLPPAGQLGTDPVAAETGAGAAPASAASREGSGFAAALDAAGRAEALNGTGAAALEGAPGARAREGAPRPPAPRPRQARRFGWPAAVLALLCLAVAVGIGIAAYRMRDKPEQVVASRSGSAVSDAAPGKVADRAGPAGTAAGDAEGAAEPASGVTVTAPVAQNAPDAASSGPAIAVAQRAALLVDAPEDPQRVKTYVGTVVWHLDSVSPGQGQPLASAVKADIDIPDAKLKVSMLMQRNPEPQLPASHTIEFHFLPQPGNTLGPVKQVNVPEMRKDDESPTGDPLAGVPVAITENYFLVGLSRGGAEGQNARLITERNWFDMSLLFTSGKLGKLTFEKGAAGQRSFEDALKAWK